MTWLPADRLDIAMDETATPNLRRLELTGQGSWQARLARLARSSSTSSLARTTPRRPAEYLQGDASTRAYARLVLPGRTAILMNAPRQPDGPPIRDGKPYSALVHLAEDVTPFVAVGSARCASAGLSAPAIYAFDLAQGFLLLEDLGDRVFTRRWRQGRPLARALRREPSTVLLALRREPPPTRLPIEGHAAYALPAYDADALLTEALLLVDWYWPALHGGPAPDERAGGLYRAVAPLSDARRPQADPGWVLRDFHSPNLMWLPERQGLARVGLLDFQDALAGPAAYDLVSLLQDARLDVPEALEAELLARYCAARSAQEPQFSSDEFRDALCNARRSTQL